MSWIPPHVTGSCSGVICYRSSETGELWCARLRKWLDKCPKDDGEGEVNEEWMGEED